tara:strand:- start:203 stop:715 length:513 start_codon:yes stop_codon:yes gene_type:complete
MKQNLIKFIVKPIGYFTAYIVIGATIGFWWSILVTLIVFGLIESYLRTKKLGVMPLGKRLIYLYNEDSQESPVKEDDKEKKVTLFHKYNENHKEHFKTVQDHVLKHLTKTYIIHQDEIKKIEDQIKQISSKKDETVSQLSSKIEDEKISTQKLMKKHPFLKTLEDIQNRT